MIEVSKKKLSDSAGARWAALFVVAFTMMAAYYVNDVMAPLKSMLEGQLRWTSGEFGTFTGAYSFLNVFLLMLIWGGLILDRFGIRFTGILAAVLMVGGTACEYLAITHYGGCSSVMFGMKLDVFLASAGYSVFGVGAEVAGITVTKIIAKWFQGKEMALAMGVQVAMARLGTASALSLSPLIAQTWGLPSPIIVGTLLLLLGFAVFVGYCFADKHFDVSGAENFTGPADNSEPFRWHDFTALLRNPGFWLIALLCVSYYSSIRPFMKFATDLLISRYHADPVSAGWLVSIIPYGSIVLTPVFGMLYDRIGRGATLMLIGSALLTAIHICFALPIEWSSSMAIVLMVVLGVAFSLVPSAMWPSVPKIIPLKELGTAYSIIYYIQNIGLMLVPMMVGDVLKSDTTAGVPDFTRTQWIFAAFGLAAVVIAFVLLFVDRKKHYGLEEANISNHA